MKKTNTWLILITLYLVIVFSALSQGATAGGEVAISDDGNKLQVKLKIASRGNENSVDGFFQYHGGDDKVLIDAACLKVDGEYAWFAGKCVEGGANYSGRWLFAAVHDGGKPGRLVDHIWWEWIPAGDNAESIAKGKVRNMQIPSGRKEIQSGDIKVDQ